MKDLLRLLIISAVSLQIPAQLRPSKLSVNPEGTDKLSISVASYYPLKDVIDYLDYQFGWNISYEDPLYLESQLTDIAAPSWKKAHPGERGYYVPPWTAMLLQIDKPTHHAGEQQKILNGLVSQYNQLDRSDKFEVQAYSDTHLTVIGSMKSVQVWSMAKLSPQKRPLSGSEYLEAIAGECGGQTPMRLVIGTVPMNALAHLQIPAQAKPVFCRDAIANLTERVASDAVYQIMHDVGDQMFVISIYPNSAYRPASK